jgi:hypothetical protein
MENDEQKTLEQEIARWGEEIADAKKRDERYLKDGEKVLKIYACNNRSEDSYGEISNRTPFNILFSNTDTLIPALYSALPRPVVSRRFKDEDPTGKAAAEAATRVLEFLIDTNIDGYESFNDGMNNAVLDALLPGRGVTMVKYDAEINGDEKGAELICLDSKKWDRVYFGYAHKWSKVPWLAFEENIDKQEAIELFGKEMAANLKFQRNNDGTEGDDAEKEHESDQGLRKTCTIYQIWDKDGGKKVRYISRDYGDNYLKVLDDPLELTGFYPIPRPLRFMANSDSLDYVAPYMAYEEQATELNDLTRRITKTIDAIRAKAIYDAELGDDLENLTTADDAVMVPADKGSLLASQKGLDNAIWFFPVEKLILVLRELYQSRDACKNVIYEITGISDVIRGASVASETATAQSIKSQWGSMRLKRNQAEVGRYARDLMRIMLEIAAQNFNEQAWVQMTGLPFATTEQVQQAQVIMQQAQAFIAAQPELQQMPPEQLMQQIPPQYAQMFDQAQQTLAMPKWSDVMALLKNDFERAYRIDIETNSTVMPEATEDQQNITQAMDAMSRFIGEIMPLVQQGAMSWDVVKTWLKAMLRRYQFGNELEDYIDKMQQPQPPAPPAPPPDHTLEAKQMDIQAKQQSDQLTLQLEQQKAQIQQQADAQAAELQRIIEQGKAATEMRVAEMNINAQAELEAMRLAHEKELEAMRLQAERELALELEQIRVAGNLRSTAMTVNKQIDEDAALEYSEAGEAVPKQGINDLVNAISQSLLVIAESNKQAAQANQMGLEALALQIGRPKEVIRGADGRVVGVQ